MLVVMSAATNKHVNRKMLVRLLVVLLALFDGHCIDKDICFKRKVNIKYCNMIFIWNKEKMTFIPLYEITNNLNRDVNKTLRILVQRDIPPYIITLRNSTKIVGYVAEIWDVIQDFHKFKYNMTKSVDYDDGVDALTREEVDIFLACGIAQDYHFNIYHTQPYFNNWYHLYLKSPEREPSSYAYINTFSKVLWTFSMGLFSLLTVFLWITIKCMNLVRHLEPNLSLATCFLAVVSGFINQGFDLKLYTFSTRIQLLFALLFGVVLYAAMNAVLFSQMAIFETVFPFSTLENIAERGTYSLCVRTDSFVYNFFRKENHNGYRPEWKGIVNNDRCMDINDQENVGKIICRDNVIILENTVIMSTVSRFHSLRCDIVNFKKQYFLKGNVFMLRKGLPARRSIGKLLTKMRSYGIFARLENIWMRRERKEKTNVGKFNPGTMSHIKCILCLYTGMIFISLIILGVEILWKKFN